MEMGLTAAHRSSSPPPHILPLLLLPPPQRKRTFSCCRLTEMGRILRGGFSLSRLLASSPAAAASFSAARRRSCTDEGEAARKPYCTWRLPTAAMRGRVGAGPGSQYLFRRFGRGSRGDEPLGRDWLAQLWAEEKKKAGGLAGAFGSGRRKKPVTVQVGDTVEGEGAGSWTSLVSSFRRSFLRGADPGNHLEKESASRRPQPPHIRQQIAGSLLGDSPEEVKLESLLARANLVITRDIEWANIMFAFEQESRYIIVDAADPGSPVGFIREQSNIIYRQLLRSRRPFTAYITDAWGNEIFTVRRPFWWINSTIYAEVDGKEIGVVHRRWHLWRRIYDLYLINKQFAVVENPGFWNWTFTLKDDGENVLAEINRDWRGIGLELFTDAGQYVIRFGCADSHTNRGAHVNIQQLDVSRPLTLSERAVAVALAISLDCDYFSRSGGWGLPFVVAGE